MATPGPALEEARATIDAAARAAGRDPAAIGTDARVSWRGGGLDGVVGAVAAWRAAGATHVSVNTMDAGLGGPDGHVEALRAVAEALGTA
jgi:hypothetical protein